VRLSLKKKRRWLFLTVDTAALVHAIWLAVFKHLPFRLRMLSLVFMAYFLGGTPARLR
jgi:hypothetical protein